MEPHVTLVPHFGIQNLGARTQMVARPRLRSISDDRISIRHRCSDDSKIEPVHTCSAPDGDGLRFALWRLSTQSDPCKSRLFDVCWLYRYDRFHLRALCRNETWVPPDPKPPHPGKSVRCCSSNIFPELASEPRDHRNVWPEIPRDGPQGVSPAGNSQQ